MKSKLYYEEYGRKDGQSIIFINGWGTDHSGLERECLKYFLEYRCIFIDALGCGKSPMYEKNGEFLCVQTANEIIYLIDDLQLHNVILYGNCVGGWIGALVALTCPKISHIIFLDGYLFFDREYLFFVLPIIARAFYIFFFQTWAGLSLSNLFVGFSQKISKELIAEQKLIRSDVAVDYIRDLYRMERAGYREKISSIKVKSIFLVGEHTLPVIKRSQKYWIENVPNAIADIVPHTSHLMVSENPEGLNKIVKKFMNT